jgi:hypothetical protein
MSRKFVVLTNEDVVLEDVRKEKLLSESNLRSIHMSVSVLEDSGGTWNRGKGMRGGSQWGVTRPVLYLRHYSSL